MADVSTLYKFPHGLSKSIATSVVDRALLAYQQRFPGANARIEWVSEDRVVVSFIVFATPVVGTVIVTEEDVCIAVEMPLKFKIFEGMAVKIVGDEVHKHVEQAKQAHA